MTDDIQQMLAELEAFEQTPLGYAQRLRLDFAQFLLRKANGLSVSEIADKAGVKPRVVTAIFHSDMDARISELGLLMWAIDQLGANRARP